MRPWEVIRIREGHVGEAHIMGSGALSHERRSLFVPYEDIAERLKDKESPHQQPNSARPWLRISHCSETNEIIVCCISHQVYHIYYSSLNWLKTQPKHTRKKLYSSQVTEHTEKMLLQAQLRIIAKIWTKEIMTGTPKLQQWQCWRGNLGHSPRPQENNYTAEVLGLLFPKWNPSSLLWEINNIPRLRSLLFPLHFNEEFVSYIKLIQK